MFPKLMWFLLVVMIVLCARLLIYIFKREIVTPIAAITATTTALSGSIVETTRALTDSIRQGKDELTKNLNEGFVRAHQRIDNHATEIGHLNTRTTVLEVACEIRHGQQPEDDRRKAPRA
jgi:hypothetical protein